MCNKNDAVARLRREVQMFYVTSKDLPTIAYFTRMSRAYVFKQTMIKLGYEASVIKMDREC